MPQEYDPLSQEDDSHTDIPRAGIIPRPAVYYGEGPFDPPSSEDEDEDEVTEKDASASLNRAEGGGQFRSHFSDDGLYVGRQKVRASTDGSYEHGSLMHRCRNSQPSGDSSSLLLRS
jgi:hypothetical protein